MQYLDHYDGPEPNGLINEILLRRGISPAGFPLYRVVRSEHIFEQSAGLWNDWDDDLNEQDRGGMFSQGDGNFRPSSHRPDRIVPEMRHIPAYTHFEEPGWVLERWFPGSYFGSAEAWESIRVPGTNLPILGPFPADGKYLMQVGPFTIEPDISFLIDFIAHRESRWENMPRDVDLYVKQKVSEAEAKEERLAAKRIAEDHHRVMESIKPLTSSTLEAGRWRDKMWQKSGHTSHLGN